MITVRRREGLTARPRTFEDRPIAIAHMSPGETKNEECGFLLFGGSLPRRLVRRSALREGGSHERSECLAKAGSGGAGRLFLPAALAIPGEDRSLVFEAEERSQRAPGEGVRQHFERVPQDEPRAVAERRRHVPHLHPALGPPAQELDLVGRRGARVRTTAVVPSYSSTSSLTIRPRSRKSSRHRRARIRRRVLDVRPVDVPARERQVRLDRLARVVRIADDQAADDEHAVRGAGASMAVDRRVADRAAAARGARSSPRAFRNARSSSRTFSMPRNT